MVFKWFKKDTTKPKQPAEPDDRARSDTAIEADPAPQIVEPESTADETIAQLPAADTGQPDAIPEEEPSQPPAGATPSTGYFHRLKNRLSRTRKNLSEGLDKIFAGKMKFDETVIEDLEEFLITSDIGVQTTMELIERISKARVKNADELKAVLKKEILTLIIPEVPTTPSPQVPPRVVMVVGVNGVGKTTTIGKIAAAAKASGQKVMIAAADTFRAAAVEQLAIWAQRAGAEFVQHRENADPAAVAFDAVAAAQARGCDLVLIDTAGRLHTKVNLMEELKKIKRTVAKQVPGAPHEVLLVLDATTGQNALSQAKLFHEAVDVTALALTKLDGTAKGGIVIAICGSLNIPLQYIGIGENIEDLRPFDPQQFVEALF
jgi:fused signal recognition particle receptor